MSVVRAYEPIIFETVAYQNGANTVYQYWANQGSATTAPRQFKSDAERMQYKLGRQNQASCGVPAPGGLYRKS
jgi:hypothetical protein